MKISKKLSNKIDQNNRTTKSIIKDVLDYFLGLNTRDPNLFKKTAFLHDLVIDSDSIWNFQCFCYNVKDESEYEFIIERLEYIKSVVNQREANNHYMIQKIKLNQDGTKGNLVFGVIEEKTNHMFEFWVKYSTVSEVKNENS